MKSLGLPCNNALIPFSKGLSFGQHPRARDPELVLGGTTLGAVLVHRYTGSAKALARLAARLENSNPVLSTTTVGLHQCAETAAMKVPRPPAPRLNSERFVEIVKRRRIQFF